MKMNDSKTSVKLCLITLVGIFLFFSSLILLPSDTVQAVPSYARQTGRSCVGCHTMWPGRLKRTGRDFKLDAYTEVAPEQGRLQKDGLDLLNALPLSGRAIIFPFFRSTSGPPRSRSQVHEVELFYGTRLSPRIGMFIESEFEDGKMLFPIVRFAYTAPKIRNAVRLGFVTGQLEPGGADPYNTLRKPTRMTRVKPEALRTGELQLWSSDNWGGVVNAFIRDRVYLAAGLFRGAKETERGPDFFGRAALDLPIKIADETGLMVGGFVYTGDEKDKTTKVGGKDVTYDTSVLRVGGDVQFQFLSGPHTVEVIGLLLKGKDDNFKATGEVTHTGSYLEGFYTYDFKWGGFLRLDRVSSDNDALDQTLWTIRPVYMPWPNIKLGIEFENYLKFGTKTGKEARQAKSRSTFIVDVGF